MLTIYGIPTFNTTKVLLTAEELGLNYKYAQLDFSKGENKTLNYLEHHPLGKVPSIEYDGESLFESNAICRFLALQNVSTLYTGTAREKALIDQWIDLMAHHIGRWMGVIYFQEFIRPNFLNESPEPSLLKEAQGFLDTQIPVLEKQLSKQKFLLADTITIADIIAFSYVLTHEHTSLNLDKYKNLMSWYKTIKDRESFKKAMTQYSN